MFVSCLENSTDCERQTSITSRILSNCTMQLLAKLLWVLAGQANGTRTKILENEEGKRGGRGVLIPRNKKRKSRKGWRGEERGLNSWKRAVGPVNAYKGRQATGHRSAWSWQVRDQASEVISRGVTPCPLITLTASFPLGHQPFSLSLSLSLCVCLFLPFESPSFRATIWNSELLSSLLPLSLLNEPRRRWRRRGQGAWAVCKALLARR